MLRQLALDPELLRNPAQSCSEQDFLKELQEMAYTLGAAATRDTVCMFCHENANFGKVCQSLAMFVKSRHANIFVQNQQRADSILWGAADIIALINDLPRPPRGSVKADTTFFNPPKVANVQPIRAKPVMVCTIIFPAFLILWQPTFEPDFWASEDHLRVRELLLPMDDAMRFTLFVSLDEAKQWQPAKSRAYTDAEIKKLNSMGLEPMLVAPPPASMSEKEGVTRLIRWRNYLMQQVG